MNYLHYLKSCFFTKQGKFKKERIKKEYEIIRHLGIKKYSKMIHCLPGAFGNQASNGITGESQYEKTKYWQYLKISYFGKSRMFKRKRIKKDCEIIRYLGIKTYLKMSHCFPNAINQKYDNNSELALFTDNFNYSGKIAVYTVLIGGYDRIKEPQFADQHIDYYIVTDQDLHENSKWKKIDVSAIERIPSIQELNNVRKNRFYKLHPHLLFPEYEYSIYIDANFFITGNIAKLVQRMGDKNIGLYPLKQWHDSYVGAAAVVLYGKIRGKAAGRQMKAYRKEGFPENYGLYENCIIVRKHNDTECISLMNAWWEQLCIYTHRDQFSFMYTLWKLKKDANYVAALGTSVNMCPFAYRILHDGLLQSGD